MITTKQRAKLRSLANKLSPIMQIGKDNLKQSSFDQIEEMLNSKELFKIKVLKNADGDIKEFASIIAEKTGCEVVQVIGNVICLYKRSSKKGIKNIELD